MFKNISEDLSKEISHRVWLKNKVIPFGIDYLDDTCYGISPNDLILLGARSGAGKTQLCTNLAVNAMRAKKRVHFFALEADPKEIERRLKFGIFQKLFKEKHPGKFADFQKWNFGHYLPNEMLLEKKVIEVFKEQYPSGLFTFYKTGDFSVTDMVEHIVSIAEETDLIIIDHVHYFDFDDDNENRAIKVIAKTARDLVLENKVPIILVSHMRKGNPKTDGFAPSLEDFHGSSDLFKIATRAITLGPGNYDPSGIAQTYMHIVKNRFDSSVTRFIGRVSYNFQKGSYEEGYQIGGCHQKREREFETLDPDDLPGFVRPKVRRNCLLLADSKKENLPANSRGQDLTKKMQVLFK